MSERAAFISAILDNLADDTPRLVFADWLQEHGEEARAEFIRCQIEAAKLPKAKREKSKPAKRTAALLKKHEAEWRKVVPEKQNDYFYQLGGSAPGYYDRGFLEYIGIYSPEFLDVAGPLLTVEPATIALFLSDVDADEKTVTLKETERLAASPCLRAVEAMFSAVVRTNHFARVLQSPHLINVRAIIFVEFSTKAKDVRILAAAPALTHLERLYLSFESYNRKPRDFGDAVRILATSPQFRSLKYLRLDSEDLDDKHIKALLTSTTLPRGLHLNLDGSNYDEERFAEALAKRFTGESDREED